MTNVAEADGLDAEAEEGEEAPKSKKKLFIIIGAAVLVLLLAGAGAYFLLFSGSDEQNNMEAKAAPAFFYDMPAMTVNLNADGSDGQQFLKLTVSLELADESMLEILEPRMARVRDAFQVYLRELRRSDLEGSAGIFRLKEELRHRVNLAIYPARVENILFKEILVQ